MDKRIQTTIYFLLLFGVSSVDARHIVGGGITYACKGGGNYTFTMKVYRDANGGGAGFDDPASIAIYNCGALIPCNLLSTFDAFQVLNVENDLVTIIQNPVYPCLVIPPNILVEEGIYTFDIFLPLSPESYHIVYQRCCRNNTINNIYNPEDTGASFSIEITPSAQQLCNNSAVFVDFPPTVICAGEPLNYLHNATDVDGDQLVYEFCAPLKGGGPILQGPGTTGCNGVIPSPACPPPFEPVDYILPAYSPIAPLGGVPVITIDPLTGLITGTPDVIGQFVVGVCVYEYRNGQLLSVIRRDFQFNVTSCEATVVADLKKDAVISSKSFLLNSCGENTIQFLNQSYQTQNITGYLWQFNINGITVESSLKDPVITFPGPGQYVGKMIVNPGFNCSDSALIYVNVFPSITADFEFDYDTCVAGNVDFTDLSVSGSGNIISWDWLFEPGGKAASENPSYLYSSPGIKPVSLKVTDINECMDSITKEINWFPVPPVLIIEPSSFLGCEPATIFFNNLSSPIDSTYIIEWHFGDGGTGSAISPSHIYSQPGIFSVSVEITSPIGCTTMASFSNWITIEPSPNAQFSYNPTVITSLDPTVQFIDESTGANRWLWQFDNNGTAKIQNPLFTFPDTGFQTVILTVTHPSGCQDTAMALIDVIPDVRYFMPNAFSPNRDGLNDFFVGNGILVGIKSFEMHIYNRWGELIYESNDPEKGWDGTYAGSNDIAPPGVYTYLLSYMDSRGNTFSLKGFATLVQ